MTGHRGGGGRVTCASDGELVPVKGRVKVNLNFIKSSATPVLIQAYFPLALLRKASLLGGGAATPIPAPPPRSISSMTLHIVLLSRAVPPTAVPPLS